MSYVYSVFVVTDSGKEVFYHNFASKSYAAKVASSRLMHSYVIEQCIPFCSFDKKWFYKKGSSKPYYCISGDGSEVWYES